MTCALFSLSLIPFPPEPHQSGLCTQQVTRTVLVKVTNDVGSGLPRIVRILTCWPGFRSDQSLSRVRLFVTPWPGLVIMNWVPFHSQKCSGLSDKLSSSYRWQLIQSAPPWLPWLTLSLMACVICAFSVFPKGRKSLSWGHSSVINVINFPEAILLSHLLSLWQFCLLT